MLARDFEIDKLIGEGWHWPLVHFSLMTPTNQVAASKYFDFAAMALKSEARKAYFDECVEICKKAISSLDFNDQQAKILLSILLEPESFRFRDTIGAFLVNGPKVIVLTKEISAALDNIDISVYNTDYMQPYETVFVIDNSDSRMSIIRHIKCDCCLGYIRTFIIVDDGKRYGATNSGQDLHLGHKDKPFLISSVLEDDVETKRFGKYLCMLMLMSRLPTYETWVDEIRYKKTLKLSKVKTRKVREKARDRLLIEPQEIKLSSKIKLFRTQGVPSGSTGTGEKVRPHWRRGHMRHQVCGKGRLDRKLIYIPPVCIHANELPNNGAELTTTYVG